MKQADRTKTIIERLRKEYPEVEIKLSFSNPFQLLIATILSAQCTDDRVNIVTKDLFKKYKKPEDFAVCSQDELEKDIFSTGFYKQKAKSIISCSDAIVKIHKGKVPSTLEELTKLPGVGRKTAAVILGNAYGIPAVTVDTHVKRLSNLFGWVETEDPEKIEFQLMEILPQKEWTIFSHRIAKHGREICNAKKPKCSSCFLNDVCPSAITK